MRPKPSSGSNSITTDPTTPSSDIQTQAAETTNDSPTAAIPIPANDLTDLERGEDDLAATLVNDEDAEAEASTSRSRWANLIPGSLGAFTGEAKGRKAGGHDRDR